MSKAIISIEAHGNKTTVEIPSDSNIDGYVYAMLTLLVGSGFTFTTIFEGFKSVTEWNVLEEEAPA